MSSDSSSQDDLLSAWRSTVGPSFDQADPQATVRPPIDEDSPTLTPAEAAARGIPVAAAPAPKPAGPFSLLGKLGQGGMGVVYRAEQTVLRREVAFKQPIDPRPNVKAMFTAEALVTGYLEHPNIVPIHHLGVDENGQTFFTMKLVHGIAWSELLHPDKVKAADRRAAVTARARGMDLEAHLRTLVSVCNAVAFAHARNILHRDLKPENVMIGDFGEVLVMDWGIAVDMSAEPPQQARTIHSSKSGLGGTPAYMAPEMAKGEGKKYGPWTDVYLLGAILHEILTGRSPHKGGSLQDVLQHAAESPAPVLDGSPAELAAICRKAMAKETAARYPDVRGFQEAVEGFLKHRQSTLISERAEAAEGALDLKPDQPARKAYEMLSQLVARYDQALELWDGNESARAGARRVRLAFARVALERGDLELARSQVEQVGAADADKAGEGAALKAAIEREKADRAAREESARFTRQALVGCGALLFVSLAVGFLWIRAERNQKVVEAQRADQNAAVAQQESAAAVKARDQEATERKTAQVRLAEGQVYRAQAAASLGDYQQGFVLMSEALDLRAKIGAGLEPVRAALIEHVARFGVPLWAVAVDDDASSLAWAPDGKRVAVGGIGYVSVRETLTGRQLARSTASARGLAWAANGRFLAAVGEQTVLIDAANGQVVRELLPASEALKVALTADSKHVLAGGIDGILRMWNVEDGRLEREMKGPERAIAVLSVNREGTRAFTGQSEQRSAEIQVWDLATGNRVDDFQWNTQYCSAGAFTPDGKLALSGATDTIVRSLDIAKKQELRAMSGHRDVVKCVEAFPDGKRAISGGEDHAVKVWNVEQGSLVRELGWHGASIAAVAVSPDALHAASVDQDGNLAVWSLDPKGPTLRPFPEDPKRDRGYTTAAAISPDGSRAATAGVTGTITVWDTLSGREIARLAPPARIAPRIAELIEKKELWDFRCESTGIAVASMALSTNAVLQVARTDGAFETWNVDARSLDRERTTTGEAAIDARGRYGVRLTGGTKLAVIELATGRALREVTTPFKIGTYALGVSTDGKRVIGAFHQSVPPYTPREQMPPEKPHVLIWDAGTGKLSMVGDTDAYVTYAAIAPDGSTGATFDQRRVNVWDLATGQLVMQVPDVRAGTGVYSPDGAWLYLVDRFGEKLRIVDVTQRRVVGAQALHGVGKWPAVARDGSWLLFGTKENREQFPPTRVDLDVVVRLARAWTRSMNAVVTLSERPADAGALYQLGAWFHEMNARDAARTLLAAARKEDPAGALLPVADIDRRLKQLDGTGN